MSQSVSSLCVGKGLFESLRSKSCSRSLSNSNATNFYRFVSMFGLLNVKSLVGNFADNYPNFATNRQYPSKDVLDAFANQHHFCRPIEYDLHFRWGFSEYVFLFSAAAWGWRQRSCISMHRGSTFVGGDVNCHRHDPILTLRNNNAGAATASSATSSAAISATSCVFCKTMALNGSLVVVRPSVSVC